jgi:pimeloyl-ACP methyl ester carboxylesterase
MAELHLEPGLKIFYQEFNPTGSPDILLLHGLGANGDSWQLQVPTLCARGYRLIIPDMRGFGRSSFPGGPNNPSIMALDMMNLMERLSTGRYHLDGISLGGTVALQMVIHDPQMIKSLTITNSFAKLRPGNLSQWFFYGFRLVLAHLIGIKTQAKYVANRLFPRSDQELFRTAFIEQVSQSNPMAYRATMRSLAFFDVTAQIQEINTPTLVITGENDTVVPPVIQAELTSMIPGARHLTIQHAGHAVTIESAEQYNQAFLDFIQNLDHVG